MTDFTMTDDGVLVFDQPPPTPRSIIPLVSMRQYLVDRDVWALRCEEAFRNGHTSEASMLFLRQHAVVKP